MRRFVLFLLLTLLPIAALAQDAPAWEVVALHADSREVITITPDGITSRVALPDGFTVGEHGARLSPDGRLIASLSESRNTVRVANLDDGTCCAELPFIDADPTSASLAGFSPDGTKLAAAYMIAEPFSTEIVALDLATSSVLVRQTMTPAPGDNLLSYPVLDSWRDDGVYFARSCIQCVDYAAQLPLEIWSPDGGALSVSGERGDVRADTLPLRHEQLIPTYAAAYPAEATREIDVVGGDLWGLRNTVELSGLRAANGRDTVYFSPDNLSIDRARWVADGNAFIVFPTSRLGTTMLVMDGGSLLPVGIDPENFLAGTPDGWLTIEDETLVHYTLASGDVTRAELGAVPADLIVLTHTPLGTSASAAFVSVPPPEPVTCPGFVVSRLQPGHRGRVLPGAANNVRDEPSTTGTIVAKIAGGASFVVLEGPECAQGLAWWRVAYFEWEGWTAEGSGNAYWVEPLD